MVERHPRHAQLPRERLRELGLADQPQLDEQLPELPPVLALREEHLLELRLRQDARLDEELAEALRHRCIVRQVPSRVPRDSLEGRPANRAASVLRRRRMETSSLGCGRVLSAAARATRRISSARRAAFPSAKVAASPDDPLIGRTLPGRLRHPRARRRRRHGPRLPRRADEPRPHRRGQDHPPAPRRRRERRRALHHRGARREPPQPPELGRASSTSARRRRAALPRHGVPARARTSRASATRKGRSPFRRIVDVLRQVLAALAEAHHLEHHPPRSQAREHHPRADARRRRLREGRRLRPREDARRDVSSRASRAPASSAARPST